MHLALRHENPAAYLAVTMPAGSVEGIVATAAQMYADDYVYDPSGSRLTFNTRAGVVDFLQTLSAAAHDPERAAADERAGIHRAMTLVKNAAQTKHGRRRNPVTAPYEARLQAALLTPTKFEGRHVLEKLAQLPDPAASTDQREEHEPWAGYLSIRNRALAELRSRLGFPGAAEEVAEAQEAYVQALHQRIRLRDAGLYHQRADHVTVEELRADPMRRRYFQGHLDLALEAATRGHTRGMMDKAEKELEFAIKHGPPDLAHLKHRRRAAPRRRNPVTSRVARYQAAVLTPKAFRGRKDLQQYASNATPGGDVALAKLRLKLGFKGAEQELVEAKEAQVQHDLAHAHEHRSIYGGGEVADLTADETEVRRQHAARLAAMPDRQRVIWALQQDDAHRAGRPLSNAVISDLELAHLVARDELKAREEKRETRGRAPIDPLAVRTSGHGERTMIEERLRRTIGQFRNVFRQATQSHEDVVHVVAPGEERVVSTTGAVRGGYRAYFRTTSRHEWYVSRAQLTPQVRALNESARRDHIVYLRPDLRVVQGRGTALVMQHKRGARGGWS